jgi:membrane associated rhomboid family serine protease
VLTLVGANLKAEVESGGWWRLHASTFLHYGLLHLGLNMYMLLVLGKLVEQIFGPWRMFALYSVAGAAGSLASYLYGHGAISLGASGAVFGVLGAAIAELALRRQVYPETWRRILLGNLVFVAVANLAIGWAYQELIDQSAHVGGFLAGGVCGVVFSRRAAYGRMRLVRALAGALVALSFASLAYSAWGVSTSVFRTAWKVVDLDGIVVEVPPTWMRVFDGKMMLAPHLGRRTLIAQRVKATSTDLDTDAQLIAERNADDLKQDEDITLVEPVPSAIPAPDGWAEREHRVEAELDVHSVFRQLTFVRHSDGVAISLVFLVPEARVAELAANLPRILASARLR